MTAAVGTNRPLPRWIVRRAPWFILVIHLPFALGAPIYTITGLAGPNGDPLLVVSLAAVTIGLQLRHSFASMRNERSAYWPWSFGALLVLVYGPLPHFSWNWGSLQTLVVASALMLLRGWLVTVFVAAPVVCTAIWVWHYHIVEGRSSIATMLAYELYWLSGLVVLGGALYGATRLVHVLGELYATRTELAAIAISRDRIRISRDLHDLLGQSLSAVSLKGDLAIRLLPRNPAQAGAEIEGLTDLAREALHDVRGIARDEHHVSLRQELDAAAGLLDTTGIVASIDADTAVTDQHVEEVMAWAIREGTTNLLRHSDARTCSITLVHEDGVLRLTILNDAVRSTADGTNLGTGLDGLRERARTVSGTIDAGPTGHGWYRLLVEIPER